MGGASRKREARDRGGRGESIPGRLSRAVLRADEEGIVQTTKARHDALEELSEELTEGREEEEIPGSPPPLDAREGGFPRALPRGPQAYDLRGPTR